MLHAALDTCQERPWVYVKSAGWSERADTPQAGAAHQRPGDPGRRRAKELTLLIRIHHKGRRTRRGVSAGGRGVLSAMLFLAAATTWSSERFRQSFAEIHRHTASASGLPKAEKTQTAPPPASCETGASFNQGRQEAASLRATKVGNLAAALHAADLASAKPLVVRSRTRRAVGRPAAPLTARHRP